MAGIMKFFKPTDGGGKRKEPGAVGTTAGEVFSPVCNTKGVERAGIRPTVDTDSDVEIVDEEVLSGLKRKRNGCGHTGCGLHTAQARCADAIKASQENCQSNASLGLKADQIVANLAESVTAVAEVAGPIAGTNADALQEATTAALTSTKPMLSPDLAAREPTAKRQRVPETFPETSVYYGQKPSHQHNQKPRMDTEAVVTQQENGTAPEAAVTVPVGTAIAVSDLPLASVVAVPAWQCLQQYGPISGDNFPSSSAAQLLEVRQELQVAEEQQPQQHHEHQDDTANTFHLKAQQSAADTGADAMDADASASTAGGAGAVAATETGVAATAALTTADGDGAINGGTGAKSGGAGPATLPPHLELGATLESLRQELEDLEAALEVEMLLPESETGLTITASEGGRLTSMPTPAQLCVWLEGRTAPLSALIAQLEPLTPSGTDPTALRTCLVDLAQRKCYSDKEAPLDGAAASEDATPGRLWVWEVREPRKHLQGDAKDASARKLAEAMRKRRKELRERLMAVGTAAEALSAHQLLTQPPAPTPAGGGTQPSKGPTAAARRASESRAAKAYNRLGRLANLEVIEAAFRSASEGLTPAAVGIGNASARKERALKELERERAREEKARQREEEARAKEAKRAQEDEAKRKVKEAAAANKAGYHSNKELQKSRNIMQSFFKRSVQAKANGEGPMGQSDADTAPVSDALHDSSAAEAAAAGVSTGDTPKIRCRVKHATDLSASGTPVLVRTSSQPMVRDQGAPSGGRGCSQTAGATPARQRAARGTMFDFSKLARRLPDKAVVEAMDTAAARLPLSQEQLVEELRVNHKRWRQLRASRKRMIGVPPTWARRPTSPTDLRTLAAQYYGDVAALGLAPEGLRTWRRKLIAFPRKETVRPPYYGSFSRTSTSVTGRRPFGHDTSLDYEVVSDEEWEEEPEGESLSDSGDEADSQAGGAAGDGGEDEDDGFIVGDDHLSDDEGAQLSGDPDDPVDGAAAKGDGRVCVTGPAPGAGTTARFMDPRLQQLEAAIERVRTNNRPILLVRPLPPAVVAVGTDVNMDAAGAAEPRPGLYCQLRAEPRPGLNTGLDPGLLGALRPVVHYRSGDAAAGVAVAALAPPLELDVYSAYSAAAAGMTAHGMAGGEDGLFPGGVPAGILMAGSTPGACEGLHLAATGPGLLASGGPAVAPSSARGPTSGHRGRPSGPGLSAATLTALAECMSLCGDQKMDKIVEGFLATLPRDVKPPPKTKLRDAVKRLGAWSASSKRWHLHGASVAAAVEHALAMAGAAAVGATPGGGTPLPASAVAAAAAIGRVLMAGEAPTSTPTPGPVISSDLPAPVPAPHLWPLPFPAPTPCPALDGRPLLHTQPPSALRDGMPAGTEMHRPAGHQMVMPQSLMQALACLIPNAPPKDTPGPPSSTAAVRNSSLTPTEVLASAPAFGVVQLQAPTLVPALQQPQTGQNQQACPEGEHGFGEGEAMECDGAATEQEPPRELSAAAAGVRPQVLGFPFPEGQATALEGLLFTTVPSATLGVCTRASLPEDAPAAVPAAVATEARPGEIMGIVTQSNGPVVLPELPGADSEPGPQPQQLSGYHGSQALNGVTEAADANRQEGGDGDPSEAGHVAEEGAATEMEVEMETFAPETVEADASQHCPALPRPMPPAPPLLPELALLGSGHPFWAVVSSWIMGGGGSAGRSRRHGPSWTDVSAALEVFEGGVLEPRLQAVPLDLVRALVAVCQHRTASHLRSGAFKALGNLAVAAAAAALTANAAGEGPRTTTPGEGPLRRRRSLFRIRSDWSTSPVTSKGNGGGSDAAGSSMLGPVRPTGQPCRCSPQPVTLQALWSLPGMLEALRLGCCDSDPNSESDKAARSAARVLAALVGVSIGAPSAAGPAAARSPCKAAVQLSSPPPPPQQQQQGRGGIARGAAEGSAVRQRVHVLEPDVEAAGAAFRRRVVADMNLHSALRHAAIYGPGASPSSARHVFHAHMLLALQRLLHDPAAAAQLLKPQTRMAREAAAAIDGSAPPPPVTAELESKWAAKMLQSLVAGGRDVVHPGCRKGMVQCAAALMDLPALIAVIPAAGPGGDKPEPVEEGAGPAGAEPGGGVLNGSGRRNSGFGAGKGWSSLLSGNDPRAQLPAAVLTLLVSELRHVVMTALERTTATSCAAVGTEEEGTAVRFSDRRSRRNRPAGGGDGDGDGDGDGSGGAGGGGSNAGVPRLDKCGRGRVVVALQLAERALQHLGQPASRLQLRQADTRAAVAAVLGALRESGEVLAADYDPQLQALYGTVGSLAEQLT